MARQELFVDIQKLKQVIDQLEAEQVVKGAPAHRPFRSRNELYKAVAATDWGQAIGLTPVVVGLRIDRYGVECKTGVRARTMVAVPAASVASVGVAPVAPGAEPDALGSQTPQAPVMVPLQRKSMYRGIDLEAFIAPFLERGIEVNSLNSIVTSAKHTKNMNLKIQAAWHDLRERFNIPRVKDKPQEVESVLPLDQVRLPGDLLVDESVSEELDSELVNHDMLAAVEEFNSEDEDAEGLPTDEELAAEEFPELYDAATLNEVNQREAEYEEQGWTLEPTEEFDLNPESVGAVGAGWSEGDFDESLPTDDGFFDPATDEAHLEQVRAGIDEINQEGELVVDQGFNTELLPPLSEILAANNSPTQEGEAPLDQEPYFEPLPEEEQSVEFHGEHQTTEEPPLGGFHDDYLPTEELSLDEFQEQYPERKDPRDIDQELEEWLSTGEAPVGDPLETYPEDAPQDEYLPLDGGEAPTPVVQDADNYDDKMFETEETDPCDTW